MGAEQNPEGNRKDEDRAETETRKEDDSRMGTNEPVYLAIYAAALITIAAWIVRRM
jgi:hypothetical protein